VGQRVIAKTSNLSIGIEDRGPSENTSIETVTGIRVQMGGKKKSKKEALSSVSKGYLGKSNGIKKP